MKLHMNVRIRFLRDERLLPKTLPKMQNSCSTAKKLFFRGLINRDLERINNEGIKQRKTS